MFVGFNIEDLKSFKGIAIAMCIFISTCTANDLLQNYIESFTSKVHWKDLNSFILIYLIQNLVQDTMISVAMLCYLGNHIVNYITVYTK